MASRGVSGPPYLTLRRRVLKEHSGPVSVPKNTPKRFLEHPITPPKKCRCPIPDACFRDSDARSGEEPLALTGRVAVTAMVALDSGQTGRVLKDLGRLRSSVDA